LEGIPISGPISYHHAEFYSDIAFSGWSASTEVKCQSSPPDWVIRQLGTVLVVFQDVDTGPLEVVTDSPDFLITAAPSGGVFGSFLLDERSIDTGDLAISASLAIDGITSSLTLDKLNPPLRTTLEGYPGVRIATLPCDVSGDLIAQFNKGLCVYNQQYVGAPPSIYALRFTFVNASYGAANYWSFECPSLSDLFLHFIKDI